MINDKTYLKNVEIIGDCILGFVDVMGVFKKRVFAILAENGIHDPKPGHWYSQKSFLNALQTITELAGHNITTNVVQRITTDTKIPPDINSFEKMLSRLNELYWTNHRGDDTEYYIFDKIGEKSGKMISAGPYSCEFDLALVTGWCKKFKPENSSIISIKHEESAPCRKKGGDCCTYLIDW